MELEKCISERRSIRKYKNIEVSKEQIIKLIEAAQKAPSWKNSQVSRYYAITTKKIKDQIITCLPEFNQINIKNASTIIVTTVEKNKSGCDQQGNYITHLKEGFQYFDNGLQVENLCLKAHELGLGTLIMGIYDKDKIRKLLEIPLTEEITAVIGIGYPDIRPTMPLRKSVEKILHFK